MIADLHCHYPMHLVASEPDPGGPKEGWLRRILDGVEDRIVVPVAQLLNDAEFGSGWRVSLDWLEQGGAETVCSVLYWPPSEFDFPRLNNAPPLDNYFEYLQRQLQYVEETLPSRTANGTPVVLVRNSADLQREGIHFVHCVEGGFHLGADTEQLDERVAWLSREGVLYITVAHLFYRDIATEAPAIPLFSAQEFEQKFPKPDNVGLTERGERLIEAMYKHKVLIDISHMSDLAVQQTFDLVKKLDGDTRGDPKQYPIIATHVGMRETGPDNQEYNLLPKTIDAIAEREGVVGLIAAQHQLGKTNTEADSATVVKEHLDAIGKPVGGDASTVAGIGTDIDGFIKPTLEGLETARDLTKLQSWVEGAGQDNAEAILHGNAERVITAAFAGR